MNKVILMGRLTHAPEVRYTNSNEPVIVTRFTLAIQKRFKREGEPDAEFVNCVAFGKSAEFVKNYFRKGQMVSAIGRLQTRKWDKDGETRYTTEVVTEEHYFAESKKSFDNNSNNTDFTSTAETTYDELPFN